MKYLFAILFFISITHANIDYGFEASARSYPAIGVDFNFEIGHNFTIWGSDPKPGKINLMYGLLRTSAKLSSSAVVNGVQLMVELLPISLINISAGYNTTWINTDFTYFDCDIINCEGRLSREFVKGKTGFALFRFFLLGEYKVERISFDNSDKNFGDYSNVVICNANNDYLEISKVTAGRGFSSFSIGGIYKKVDARISNQSSESSFLFLKKKWNKISTTIGAGRFNSTETGNGFIVVTQLKYIGFPSLKLF